MAENETPQNDGIENVEIQPLSDEALEDVAGGTLSRDAADGSSSCCSCSLCS